MRAALRHSASRVVHRIAVNAGVRLGEKLGKHLNVLVLVKGKPPCVLVRSVGVLYGLDNRVCHRQSPRQLEYLGSFHESLQSNCAFKFASIVQRG